jgi:hypothetical protein
VAFRAAHSLPIGVNVAEGAPAFVAALPATYLRMLMQCGYAIRRFSAGSRRFGFFRFVASIRCRYSAAPLFKSWRSVVADFFAGKCLGR